ncbi:HEAT repeat domain-containing protein [Streptomyces bobili]|uniref:HEAT repeat domain-containing protein n=1 Tax=Streptomyces bobili TaxID=67280 RepID=UPI0036E2EFC6
MTAEHQIAHFLRELAGADAPRRAAAAKGLGAIGRAGHVTALARAAEDRDPAVRAAAAHGLGRLGAREAGRDPLVKLMHDQDRDVRRRALLAAVRLGLDGAAVTAAFARLLGEPDRHLRINALAGLDALGAPGDASTLVAALGDADAAVWGRASSLLYRFRDDPAVRAEVMRTAREGTGAARARVLEMLPDRCIEGLHAMLLDGLRDPSAQVRVEAARRLLKAGGGAAVDALATALDDESDPEAAGRLLIMLGARGDRRATGPALRWLNHRDAGPRAAFALGGIGTETAAERLRTALDERTLPGPTRAAAARAVGKSGAWDAVWLLLPLLDDADAELRAGVVDGLGALADGGLRLWERHPVAWALTAHLAAGGDDVWRTRNALAGLAQALPAVRRLAGRADAGEVRAAALSLLDADDPSDGRAHGDVRRFVEALDDPHEAVRYHAALGLTRWTAAGGELPPGSGGEVRDRLARLGAADPSRRLRRAATEALEALGRVTDA